MIGHHDSRGGILATRTALSHGGGAVSFAVRSPVESASARLDDFRAPGCHDNGARDHRGSRNAAVYAITAHILDAGSARGVRPSPDLTGDSLERFLALSEDADLYPLSGDVARRRHRRRCGAPFMRAQLSNSGIGVEFGVDGLKEYTTVQALNVAR